MIRVFIAAPSIAIRAGLRALLEDEQGISVVGESSAASALETAQSDVDVLVWSPVSSWSDADFTSEVSSLKVAETTAILLIHDHPNAVEKLARTNLRPWGYLSPESTQAEIITAVKALHEGLSVMEPSLLRSFFTRQGSGTAENPGMVEPLTGREMEILQLLALGLTNKQIAVRLGISAHTVKFHLSSIFGKMDTTNRTEAVKLGFERGLIVL